MYHKDGISSKPFDLHADSSARISRIPGERGLVGLTGPTLQAARCDYAVSRQDSDDMADSSFLLQNTSTLLAINCADIAMSYVFIKHLMNLLPPFVAHSKHILLFEITFPQYVFSGVTLQ